MIDKLLKCITLVMIYNNLIISVFVIPSQSEEPNVVSSPKEISYIINWLQKQKNSEL